MSMEGTRPRMTGLPLQTLLDGHRDTAFGTAALAFVEGWSDFEPGNVSVRSLFSRNIPLANPFVSSPMGTATGLAVTVRMALNGGIGVLPATFSARELHDLVAYIKSLAVQPGIIPVPFTLSQNDIVNRALHSDYSNIPITKDGSPQSEYIGTYERSDSHGQHEQDAIITIPLVSRKRGGIPLESVPMRGGEFDIDFLADEIQKRGLRALVIYNKKRWPMYLVTRKDIETGRSYSLATVDSQGRLRVACAVMKYDYNDIRNIILPIQAGADAIVVDTARGWNENVARTVNEIRKASKKVGNPCDIILGNYASRQGVRFALSLEADGLRIGQGIGSICITPEANGVWMPQLTAINECADEARGSGATICADGSIHTHFDALAAFAAGGDTVMWGRNAAATHESPAKIVSAADYGHKIYIGMGARDAWNASKRNALHHGDGQLNQQFIEEGSSIIVTIRGHIDSMIAEEALALRRSLHAIGMRSIPLLHEALWGQEGPYVKLVDISAFGTRGLHGGI